MGQSPSTSFVAAFGAPFPEFAIPSLGVGFAIGRGDVLPVGLLLLELLPLVGGLWGFVDMSLVLGAFWISSKMTQLSTIVTGLVSLGELGFASEVALEFVKVLHEGHDIGFGARLLLVGPGMVNSGGIKVVWDSLGVNRVLGGRPFLAVVGFVILGFQRFQNRFVVQSFVLGPILGGFDEIFLHFARSLPHFKLGFVTSLL